MRNKISSIYETKYLYNTYSFHKDKHKQKDIPQTYPKVAQKGEGIREKLPLKWD